MPRQEVYQSWAVFESNKILEPKKEKGGVRVRETRMKRLTSTLAFLLFFRWLHTVVDNYTPPCLFNSSFPQAWPDFQVTAAQTRRGHERLDPHIGMNQCTSKQKQLISHGVKQVGW